jgi:hypothetical protein
MGEAAGTVVHVSDLEGGDLGDVHVPLPVLVGDIVAFDEGPPQEIVSVFRDLDGRPVGVTVRPVVFLPRP